MKILEKLFEMKQATILIYKIAALKSELEIIFREVEIVSQELPGAGRIPRLLGAVTLAKKHLSTIIEIISKDEDEDEDGDGEDLWEK